MGCVKSGPTNRLEGAAMYRTRTLIAVNTEDWNAAIENVMRMNEVAKQRGWQQASIWTQTFGPFGELSIEIDYPDLATYERESAAFFEDDESMKLMIEAMSYRRPDSPGSNEM